MQNSMEVETIDETNDWWSEGTWNNITILCEQFKAHTPHKGYWRNELFLQDSYPSTLLCNLFIIFGVTTLTCFLLKPLRMPFTSQMIGGVIVLGFIFSNPIFEYHTLLPPTVLFILKTLSYLGFIFNIFMLGLEINMSVILRRVQMKSIAISAAGVLTSFVFSAAAYVTSNEFKVLRLQQKYPQNLIRLLTLNAQTFFMVTCHNLNDLGIKNSDIGRLASSIALIPDLFLMATNLVTAIILPPFTSGNKVDIKLSFTIMCYYALIFIICRPLVMYITSRTPVGATMKNTHFMYIFLIVLIVAGIGEVLDEMFALFLFSLSLPEYPLSLIFSQKLDAMTSAVFFPLYCAMQGLKTNFFSLTKRSIELEFLLIVGYVGKFLGTSISSRMLGVPFWNSLALSLIISSKGLLDIASLGFLKDKDLVDVEEYTLAILHFMIITGALLPLVRYFYEPLSQYTSINRPSVTDSTNKGTFQTLTCLYKEDNLPGIIRLIEAFHPTRLRPIPVFLLQLMPQTGRCTVPIMAPIDKVKSMPIFRTNLSYSNRIAESFLNLERESKGYTRLRHYVAMSPYECMHNDICSLAFEREVSLLILPFHMHIQWTKVGNIIEESSKAVREVNKMVLEKAPCSVAMLLDRGDPHLGIIDTSVYQVAIIFIGGADDEEALAFTRLFDSHPNVKVFVVWIKSSIITPKEETSIHAMIKNFLAAKGPNEASTMIWKEVIVNDGADTTNVLLSMNGIIDLAVVGRHHNPKCAPLHGLSVDGFTEYPELGILGDLLATPDFGFSVLVVQQEPRNELKLVRDRSKNECLMA